MNKVLTTPLIISCESKNISKQLPSKQKLMKLRTHVELQLKERKQLSSKFCVYDNAEYDFYCLNLFDKIEDLERKNRFIGLLLKWMD